MSVPATVLMALAMPAATAMVVALVYLAPSMIDRITRRRRMAAATRMAEDLERPECHPGAERSSTPCK